MSEPTIDSMTAAELDAAVAVEVMGWTVWERGHPIVWSTGNEKNPTYKWFEPSSNIGLAMQVLEKAREMNIHYWITNDRRGWFVEQGNVQRPSRFADLPRKICECVLAGVRAKKGGPE